MADAQRSQIGNQCGGLRESELLMKLQAVGRQAECAARSLMAEPTKPQTRRQGNRIGGLPAE